MNLQKLSCVWFFCGIIMGMLPTTMCSQEPLPLPLFTPVSTEHSGVTFTIYLIEIDTFYMSTFIYAYNGGGVGIGDINGDQLPDIYFTGTQQHSPNRLYLNKGNLQFEDISQTAGVDDSLGVRFGIAMVDIDADGDLDIYVSKQDFPNKLYINNGDLTFTDRAAEFGLDYCCSSTQGNFFDYDRDGDLDIYLGINGNAREKKPMVKGLPDRLFRNDAGRFVDVSKEANIADAGYALSVTVEDFNGDEWPDIFVANDFQEQDNLYINNGDGTFTDMATTYMRHSSLSSMGSDAADFNNDGRPDLVTLDMVPEQHWRKMSNITGQSTFSPTFDSTQMPRNTLQLNRGDGYFSDIGQLAGIAQTDWSWAALFADYDNDGMKDLFICNGFKRDMQNVDVVSYLSMTTRDNHLDLTLKIPPLKISNYAFRNNGDLTFENVTDSWGMKQLVNSNGAAFSDLDRDGDLDLVLNNLDTVAFILRNNAVEQKRGNYLTLQLNGSGMNRFGTGTRIAIQHNGTQQHSYVLPVRGYLSSVEPIVHFGLGTDSIVQELRVTWPDGSQQELQNIRANQHLVLQQNDATLDKNRVSEAYIRNQPQAPILFSKDSTSTLRYQHQENEFNDFNRERLLPNRFSQNGPGIAIGDVNNDGRDDMWIGGARDSVGAIYIQCADGTFLRMTNDSCFQGHREYEDMGAVFVDVDNDDDVDLYVVSGGNEEDADSPIYQDRLYLNDGTGNFRAAPNAIPHSAVSGSCVVAADYDMDGDIDLFVGGRIVPGLYPDFPRSFLLRNDSGTFKDVTPDIAPDLMAPGMVTSALWTDYDGDNDPDLIVVGEWMTPRLFRNENGSFVDRTLNSGLEGHEGWWNSVVGGDFDNDGDYDYVIGNLGMNTKSELKARPEEPLRLYSHDFDENGSRDLLMSYYDQGKEFPTRNKEDLATQMKTYIFRKFPTAVAYSLATIQQILPASSIDSINTLHATTLWSAYVENLGNGKFKITPLPTLAQISPVFGMLPSDFTGDGNLDILLVGNFFAPDRSVVRYDAGYGLLLVGNGTGTFTPLSFDSTGFHVHCDARSLAGIAMQGTNDMLVVTGCNNDWTVTYRTQLPEGKRITVDPKQGYTHSKVFYKDGTEQRQEFYIGGGYLSQSSACVVITPAIDRVEFYRGETLAKTLRP